MSLLKRIMTSLTKILRRKPPRRKPVRRKKILRRKTAAKPKPKPRLRPKARPKPKPAPVVKMVKAVKASPPAVKETEVADITHFFSKISVCVFKMTKGEVKVGDRIRIKGGSTDFVQKVKSIQIESVDVKSARRGQLVGIKVDRPARPGDKVYRVG